MGRLTELFTRGKREYNLSDASLVEILGGYQTAAGMRVNETSALQASAVYACVRAISEDVAKLPLIVYRRLQGGGKERAREHPLYGILHDQPNEIQTAFSFRETMQACLLLYGNAYAYIDRNRAGRPVGLWFLHPTAVRPERRKTGDGRYMVIYRVQVEGLGEEVLTADHILHVPGLGFDGIKGISVINYARESLGTFLAAQEYGARFFGNDTTPGLVMVAPRHLSETERQALHQQFRVRYEGVSRKFRMAIIDQGWEIRQLGISLEDAQFVQLMKFGIEEIARLFRVPPHKIGHLERATFSNIEQQNIEYYTDTLESWLVRWEQVINNRLLLPAERREYAVEHLMDGVLRADTESRYRAYATGIQWGVLTPAEARARENLNPLDGTETVWMPLNMVPVSPGGGGGGEARRRPPEERARSINGPALRRRLAISYRPIFRDAAGRVIRREVNDLKQACKRHLGTRSEADFMAWLNQYYLEMPGYAERYLAPIYHGYAETIASAAAEELGAGNNVISDEIAKLAGDIAASYAAHHAALHRNALKKRVKEASMRGEDVEAALAELLGEWEEEEPDRYAQTETIRVGGAIARAVFFGGGASALVWVAAGSDPCPLCLSFAGTKIGREDNFAHTGERIEAEGVNPLVLNEDIGHPPLHQGCECMVAPG